MFAFTDKVGTEYDGANIEGEVVWLAVDKGPSLILKF